MDMARIPMDWKELREARRIGVPESIIGKMVIGIEPNEKEKEIINKLGKAYVEAHKKNGKWVKPFLRDLPGHKRVLIRNPNGSNDVDLSEIIASELGAKVVSEEDSPFSSGKLIKLDDGKELLVFESLDEAKEEAIPKAREYLDKEPDLFDKDWLWDQIDSEWLGESMADEMYDGEYDDALYIWEQDNPDKAKRFSELDKKRDESFKKGTNVEWHGTEEGQEYSSLNDEQISYAEEGATIYTDEIKRDPLQWWEDATGEELPPNWQRYSDVDEISEEAVEKYGVAHILSADGDEHYANRGVVYYKQ